MREWSSLVHTVSALAVLSSCHAENKVPLGTKAEQEAPRPSSPKTEPTVPDAPQPDAARTTLTSLVDGLDAAWYDPSVAKDHLELLCHHLEWETRDQRHDRAPCTTEVDFLHVVDTYGTAPWAVHEKRSRLRLVRAGAQFPSVSMPVLALMDPPAKDARLIPLLPSSPTPRPKSVLLALMNAVAKIDDRKFEIPMRPRFELHGAFGGNADTIVEYRRTELFSCECANSFESAYPLRGGPR